MEFKTIDDESTNWHEYNLLMRASAKGHKDDVVEQVEKMNADVNFPWGWNKSTALMLASRALNFEIVEYLLSKNADATLVNHLNCNALMLAAEEGHLAVFKHLYDFYPVNSDERNTIRDGTTIYKQTALMLAIENDVNGDKLPIVEYIAKDDPQQLKKLNIFKNIVQIKNIV